MITQDIIEKAYYEQLMPKHYLDVKTQQGSWKIARIKDRQHRYVSVSFDACDIKDEQLFLGSFRVAPLRLNTQGYTGSQYRAARDFQVVIDDLKNHLQMMHTKFLQLPQGSNQIAFELTQYLRGDLFVNVHSLLSSQAVLIKQQNSKIKQFFIGFLDFVTLACQKSLEYAKQYFQAPSNNKLLYLSFPRIALINSLQQLLGLVNLMLKVQNSRLITYFKSNKVFTVEQLISIAIQKKHLAKLAHKIFTINDNNGKWFPFGVRKQALKLYKRFNANAPFPKYGVKDYNQVFQIYPFMLQYPIGVGKEMQQQYTKYIVSLLREQSPFEAKLRSLQQLKKILEKQVKMNYFTPADILNLIMDQGILQHMLDEYNFNPQIFKRFVPILNFYCKSKSLNQKQIRSIFKLASNRHQSELNTIYQIITGITQFAPVDSLDSIYSDIISLQINDQVTIQFIRNFTIKALVSKSKSKSFLSTIFGKKTISSKYNHYGLTLFWQEMQDNGRIKPKYILLCLEMIKSLFNQQIFHSQRQTYIGYCFALIDKKKSFGQSIRIMHGIVNSYPTSAFISQSRKGIVQKIDSKYHVIDSIMKGFKSHKSLSFQKVSYADTLKFFYHFLEEHSGNLKLQLTVQNIEYLWTQGQIKMLMQYLRKNKMMQLDRQETWKKKYMKKLQLETIRQIFCKITIKNSFYERQLTQLEYIALDDLFVSYHWNQKNISMNERGTIRYINTNLVGLDFYFKFLLKFKKPSFYQTIIKRVVEIYLRPKSQLIDEKVANWKKLFAKIQQYLSNDYPIFLQSLRHFFVMIKGKMIRQNVQQQGSMQIVVQSQGVQKVITIAKNSTIYRLRKLIMQSFGIEGNFTMHNIQMKKDVTFVEEEDYSINAMNYKNKGPSIILLNHQFQLHPHMQAQSQFSQFLASQEKLYNLLFQIIEKNQNLEKEAWEIISMLPTNRSFVDKLNNCHDFSRKNWQEILYGKKNEELQYFLNIISDMMNKNQKWTQQIYITQGIFAIQDLFGQRIKQFENETLLSKITRILLKVYQTVNKQLINKDRTYLQITALIECLRHQFIVLKQDRSQSVMNIQLFNDFLALLLRCSKLTNTNLKEELSKDNLIYPLIEYGIFTKKYQGKTHYSEQRIYDLVMQHFSDFQDRLPILKKFILEYLHIQVLREKQSIENYFQFLVDMLHSLSKQQQCIVVTSPQIERAVRVFIDAVLSQQFVDSNKNIQGELNWGALKLINYQLNSSLQAQQNLFNRIVSQFVFNQKCKRISKNKNKKLVYQILKKMLYMRPQSIEQFNKFIVPKLQIADWRKNTYSSWVIQPQKNEKKLFVGLQNLAATCYINCLFQQFYMTSEFRQAFMDVNSLDYRDSPQNNQMYQLQKIFANLKFSNRRSFTTRAFCESFITYQGRPIDPAIQSDADQFFNTLMQKIQFFLKEKNKMQILESTFQGTLSNQLNCEGCPHRSQKQQHFLSIGVNIKNKKTLDEALHGYVDGQILDGDNAYLCEPCNKKRRTTKRLCIRQLPNVLVIVLKRFEFNYDEMKRIKINHQLKYPQELNMKEYTSAYLDGCETGPDQDYDYHLKGVVVHAGTSEGGHYISFINNQAKWYQFNDELVSETTQKRVEQESYGGQQKDFDGEHRIQKYKSAYILFYHKKNKKDMIIKKSMNMEEQQSFSTILQKKVLKNNANIEFMSFIMDPTFVRFCENIAMVDNKNGVKFVLLFFHTAVLRDRNRDQYAANLFRILETRLQSQQVSYWFLQQINQKFLREFYIQSPKIVRYLSIGLLIKAISVVKCIPQTLIPTLVFCLGKKGMSPYAKIFKILSQNKAYKQKLHDFQFEKRVLAYLIDKKQVASVQPLIAQKIESYFGKDTSEKEKPLQFCPYALIQSLTQFDLQTQDAFKIFETYNGRIANKLSTRAIIKSSQNDNQLLGVHINNLLNKAKQNDYKKQQIEKYFAFLREMSVFQDDKGRSQQRNSIGVKTLADLMIGMIATYDPIQYALNQICITAQFSQIFLQTWRKQLEQNAILRRALIGWVKQSDKPHFLGKNQEWKRRTINMSFSQKNTYQTENKNKIEEKTRWMFNRIQNVNSSVYKINEDLDTAEINSVVVIGNRQVLVKQHLGFLAKVQYEKQTKWCLVERNDFQLYNSL